MKEQTVLEKIGVGKKEQAMIKSYLRAVFASAITMGIALLMDMQPQYAVLIGAIAGPLAKWADKTEKEYGVGATD
jgi:uncharacterized membrane protein YeaQ/YmgE (transglycosylase-associated protein family)